MSGIDSACKLLQGEAVDLEKTAEEAGRSVKVYVVRDDTRITVTVKFTSYDITMCMTLWDSTLFYNSQYITAVEAVFARLKMLAVEGDELSILSVKRLLVAESN